MSSSRSTDRRSKPPQAARGESRHHGIVRLTHWLTALLLAGMIGSGLQIYGAYRSFAPRGGSFPLPNPAEGYVFPEWARLGGWLAGGLNWHFALAWPFVICGLVYLGYLIVSGQGRHLGFRPRDLRGAWRMQLYYLRLSRNKPPHGKHNPLQKLAYSSVLILAVVSVASGFALYKPVQLAWLTALFGGFEFARYVHFVAVWLFVAFVLVHVFMVLVVDRASLRTMITGRHRSRQEPTDDG